MSSTQANGLNTAAQSNPPAATQLPNTGVSVRTQSAHPPAQDARHRRSFSSNLLTIFGGQAISAVLALVTEIAYAHLLGTEGRGFIGLCLMAIAVCTLAGGMGVETPAVIWAADRKKPPSQWVPGVLFAGLLGSTLACAVWYVVFWQWQPGFLRGITPTMAWLVFATIPFSIFLLSLVGIVSGLERFRWRTGIAIVDQAGALLGVALLVWVFGRNAEFAVLANLIAVIVSMGLCIFAVREVFFSSQIFSSAPSQLRATLGLGLRGILGSVATFFNYRLDIFIVNYFLDASQVGIYSLGVVISEAVWQIPRAAGVALFPRTARTLEEDATAFTCLVTRQIFFTACLTGIAVAVISPLLIPLIFGFRFAGSVPVILWIMPGTIALCVAKVISADLAGRKRPELASIASCVSLVITTVLDLFLIPRMGISGAALASSIAYFANSALLAFFLKRELKITWASFLVPRRGEFLIYRRIFDCYRAGIRTSTAPPQPDLEQKGAA